MLNLSAKTFVASWATYNLDLSLPNNFLFGMFLSRDNIEELISTFDSVNYYTDETIGTFKY